jgi:hypothetical protein
MEKNSRHLVLSRGLISKQVTLMLLNRKLHAIHSQELRVKSKTTISCVSRLLTVRAKKSEENL